MALLSPGVGRKDNSDVTMLPLVLDTEIKGWLPINQSEHTMTIDLHDSLYLLHMLGIKLNISVPNHGRNDT